MATKLQPQDLDTTQTYTLSAGQFSSTTNQLVLGTTNTTTLSATAPSASRVYTIPDAGLSANFLLDQGSNSVAGLWTFTNPLLIQAASNSGQPVSTTITNNSSSASSNAYLQVSSQSGGGNPYILFKVQGVAFWSAGIDNSDSQKFKISSSSGPGTLDRVTVQTNGRVGIGTTSPSDTLDVTGNIVIHHTGLGIDLVRSGYDEYFIGQIGTGLQIKDQTASVISLLIPTGGAAVQFPDGTFTAPGFAFINSTNTGIYSAGAGSVNISSGGTSMLVIQSNGVVCATNPFYIGDGSVSAPSLTFNNDTDCGLFRTGTDQINLVTNGTSAIIIGATQNVTIGQGAYFGSLISNNSATTLSDNVSVNNVYWLRNGSGAITINGLTGGTNGQIIIITNIDNTNSVTIKNNSGTGTVKFLTPGGADFVIGPRGGSQWIFDASGFWICTSHN